MVAAAMEPIKVNKTVLISATTDCPLEIKGDDEIDAVNPESEDITEIFVGTTIVDVDNSELLPPETLGKIIPVFAWLGFGV